jgi:hypothetical protein
MRDKNYSIDNNDLITDLYETGNDFEYSAYRAERHSGILEIDGQFTDYREEKTIVVQKNRKSHSNVSLKSFFQALYYAFRWPQLKRQLSKEGISEMTKRHGQKTVLLFLGFWLLFKFDAGNNNTSHASFGFYADKTTESVPFADAKEDEFSISEETKEKFISRFSSIAKAEMHKYGIPASVILGLAIINSKYGTSELSQSRNNFFRTTCSENLLNDGILGNIVQDDNCYVHCENAWISFRCNSVKLSSRPYAGLKETAGLNYRLWLQKFREISYPENDALSVIIEQRELYEFDE